jgi:hypothetical protein
LDHQKQPSLSWKNGFGGAHPVHDQDVGRKTGKGYGEEGKRVSPEFVNLGLVAACQSASHDSHESFSVNQ